MAVVEEDDKEEDKEDVLKNIPDWFLLLPDSCMEELIGKGFPT